MEAVIQAAAAEITLRDGKVSINGIIENINAPAFPTRVERMAVMARLSLSADEFGHQVNQTVEVVSPDGTDRQVFSAREVVLPTAEAGRPAYHDFVVRLPGIIFPVPGPYAFVFRIDGAIVAEVPVWCLQT